MGLMNFKFCSLLFINFRRKILKKTSYIVLIYKVEKDSLHFMSNVFLIEI